MKSYRTLLKELHIRDHASSEALYQQRFHSESVHKWDFQIGEHSLFALITPEVTRLIESIYQEELSILKMWQHLPAMAQEHYLHGLMLKEVVATNQIEGVFSTRREVQEALESTQPNHRFKEFAHLYLALARGEAPEPRTLPEIRSIYDAVMDGENLKADEQPDGELFRAGTVMVWDTRRERQAHSGFHPEARIHAGLKEYLHTSTAEDTPSLISAFISHLMFEVIHPFYDGNGRTGRYLLGAQVARILSPATALTLSATLHTFKDRYYQAFIDVEHKVNRAEATPFLLMMLDILTEAQDSLKQDVTARSYLFRDLQQAVSTLKEQLPVNWREVHLEIMFLMGQIQLFDVERTVGVNDVLRHTKRSASQTRKDLKLLREQGYIEAVRQRPLRLRVSAAGQELLGLD